MTTLWPERTRTHAWNFGPAASTVLQLEAERTEHPPVVLLHGFRSTSADWGPLAQRLSVTRDVWAPDLVADPAEPDGLEAVHRLIDRVVEEAGEPVDLIASSMGGYVAVSWAARGRTARRITLLAPAFVHLQRAWAIPGITRLIGTQAVLDADERRWEKELATATADTYLEADTRHHLAIPDTWRRALLDHARSTLHDEAAAGRRRARQEILRALMSTLRRPGGTRAMLEYVAAPITWLHGEDDERVPLTASREIARHLPRCRFAELAGVGHIPHLECPERIEHAVLATD